METNKEIRNVSYKGEKKLNYQNALTQNIVAKLKILK